MIIEKCDACEQELNKNGKICQDYFSININTWFNSGEFNYQSMGATRSFIICKECMDKMKELSDNNKQRPSNNEATHIAMGIIKSGILENTNEPMMAHAHPVGLGDLLASGDNKEKKIIINNFADAINSMNEEATKKAMQIGERIINLGDKGTKFLMEQIDNFIVNTLEKMEKSNKEKKEENPE